MPDPDPQPSKLRAIFPIRWLLLLSPSALLIAPIVVATALARRKIDYPNAMSEHVGGMVAMAILAAAPVLCFALGFLLEKWLRGKIASVLWALNYGFMILFANALIVFTADLFFTKLH